MIDKLSPEKKKMKPVPVSCYNTDPLYRITVNVGQIRKCLRMPFLRVITNDVLLFTLEDFLCNPMWAGHSLAYDSNINVFIHSQINVF